MLAQIARRLLASLASGAFWVAALSLIEASRGGHGSLAAAGTFVASLVVFATIALVWRVHADVPDRRTRAGPPMRGGRALTAMNAILIALATAVFWWVALTVSYGVLGGDRRPGSPPRYTAGEHYLILAGIALAALVLHMIGSALWTRVRRRMVVRS